MRLRRLLLPVLLGLLWASPAWAARKTVTVKASAGDYTTLCGATGAYLSEVGVDADLTDNSADNDIALEIQVYLTGAEAVTATCNLDGFTTDATHQV